MRSQAFNNVVRAVLWHAGRMMRARVSDIYSSLLAFEEIHTAID
jgi:hypothetical protein